MSRPVPATVLNLLFKTGTLITAEVVKTPAEVRALLNPEDENEVISIATLNAGDKVDKQGNVLYTMKDEIISFRFNEIIFFSVATVVPPSNLVLPPPSLIK